MCFRPGTLGSDRRCSGSWGAGTVQRKMNFAPWPAGGRDGGVTARSTSGGRSEWRHRPRPRARTWPVAPAVDDVDDVDHGDDVDCVDQIERLRARESRLRTDFPHSPVKESVVGYMLKGRTRRSTPERKYQAH